MKYTVNPSTNAATATAAGTGIGDWFSCAFDLLAGSKEKAMTNNEARKGAIVIAAGAALGGGYYARKRAEAGEPALLGFAF